MSRGPRRLYFAHPINAYSVPVEEQVLSVVGNCFPHDIIENPNQPHHQVGYETWRAKTAKTRDAHGGMGYFYEEVLPQCFGCVLMPFLDGRLGLGVAGEVRWFIEQSRPVWKVYLRGDSWAIKFLEAAERQQIIANDPAAVLSHEETRLRTWLVYQRTVRPFDTAHEASLPIPVGFYPEKE